MNHTSFNFPSSDGLNLFSRAWISRNHKVKGLVYLVHGLGEHTGRYAHVAETLNDSGYHLIGFDLRGHGLSEGPRGHTPEYDFLLDDIDSFIASSQQKFDFNLSKFLYGHSLGGNLVLNYGLQHRQNFSGIIVTSPLLKTAFDPPKAKLFVAKFLSQIMPKLTLRSGLETQAISRDQAIVDAYVNDPYVHDKLSTKLGHDMLERGIYALEHATEWQQPLLLMHGTTDRLSSAPASQEFSKTAGENVDLVLWEENYHELHNDLEKEKVLQTMVEWLHQHI